MIEFTENGKVFVDGKEIKTGKFPSKESVISFFRKEAKKGRKYTCTTTHCPLAEATGYVVDGDHYAVAADMYGDLVGDLKNLPTWASSFVDHWDNSYTYKNLKIPTAMTAKRALFILENLDSLNNLKTDWWDSIDSETNAL